MCRMAQQYYEYVNYKEEHVQEQKKLPKGACHSYIIVFQSVFFIIFHVSPQFNVNEEVCREEKNTQLTVFFLFFIS